MDVIHVVASGISSGLVVGVVVFILSWKKFLAEVEKLKASTKVDEVTAQKLTSEVQDLKRKLLAEVEKLKASTKVDEVTAQKLTLEVQDLERKQQNQQNDLKKLNDFTNDLLNKLPVFSLAEYMYSHLRNLFYAKRNKAELRYDDVNDHLRRELLFLADNGYIDHIDFWKLTSGEDLTQRINLTPAGQWLVQLREEREGRPIPAGAS
jgi:hypothetical protein